MSEIVFEYQISEEEMKEILKSTRDPLFDNIDNDRETFDDFMWYIGEILHQEVDNAIWHEILFWKDEYKRSKEQID